MAEHIHGRPDNEQEWYEDLFGRGAGDPDYAETQEPKIAVIADTLDLSERPF